jgi:hypothetical protein
VISSGEPQDGALGRLKMNGSHSADGGTVPERQAEARTSDEWQVERGADVLAILSSPRFEDMFWVSYRLEILSDDPNVRGAMGTREFWAEAEAQQLVWRNRGSGETAPWPFPSLRAFTEDGRLVMRGLYVVKRRVGVWKRAASWIRRLSRWTERSGT